MRYSDGRYEGEAAIYRVGVWEVFYCYEPQTDACVVVRGLKDEVLACTDTETGKDVELTDKQWKEVMERAEEEAQELLNEGDY